MTDPYLSQLRLLKLCQKELEADLCTSKSDFLRAVADLNSIKEEKTKLEAKICILESRDGSVILWDFGLPPFPQLSKKFKNAHFCWKFKFL